MGLSKENGIPAYKKQSREAKYTLTVVLPSLVISFQLITSFMSPRRKSTPTTIRTTASVATKLCVKMVAVCEYNPKWSALARTGAWPPS